MDNHSPCITTPLFKSAIYMIKMFIFKTLFKKNIIYLIIYDFHNFIFKNNVCKLTVKQIIFSNLKKL